MAMGLFSQLGNAISTIVGFRARSRNPRTRERRIGPRSEADFLEQLKEILACNAGTVQTGRVTILGLDRLKTRLGDRWKELSERVHGITRSAFAKCLGAEDIWLQF